MLRLMILGALLALIVSACGPTDADSATPDEWPYEDAHQLTYQSVGYSCGANPEAGCTGDSDMTLTEVWVHKDDRVVEGKPKTGASENADCLDLLVTPQAGHFDDLYPSRYVDLIGNADWDEFIDSGWGISIVQLDSPPEGLRVSGEAWLELTVSSFSAAEFAQQPPQSPDTETPAAKYRAPTRSDRVSIETAPGTTNFIQELVLAETTNDMMRWIIGLNADHTYRHFSGYWYGGGGSGHHNALFIKIGI